MPVWRSRRKHANSVETLLPIRNALCAFDWNTTKRPSGVMLGPTVSPTPGCPSTVGWFSQCVVEVWRSRTNTLRVPNSTGAPRFDASLSNAT
ncbi:MAG: hypothetical protein IPH13_03605 [Planctomycetes bacterium]|nr:hypothetical protein [Planctomycetota bacterium]